MVRVKVGVAVLLLLLAVESAQACEQYATKGKALVREYNGPNGLLYREFDNDNDGKADWGVAYGVKNGQPAVWPSFYAVGYDDEKYKTPSQMFTAVIVWHDSKGEGNCADITQVYIRRDNTKPLDMDKLKKGDL